ncbi:hypothetical protein DS2_04730 [Catenovulum agarivorans DS-2]|uniref:PEP-CTERM system TPR-repeat lipoprotein n=1 Tax=Catenovulum agarivorans DS-2 TaxID=1328313 RepID=W7QTG0_9ALTE|nr:XrtA/PEP-CTERM system TPR-repeat protein PrsT [Catenovulum agarivorans]EWH11133.1 hypothetical protein DS2_04730 [Catenovulum agarivorans DS-2]
MNKKYLAILLGSALMAGCGQQSYQSNLEQAQQQLSKEQEQAAVISLKNAIQQDPNQSEARVLLGSVYARQGLFSAAEKELTKAIELGAKESQVLPVLAEVWLYLEDSGSLDKYSDKNDDAKFYLAAYHLNQGLESKAVELFTQVSRQAGDGAIYKLSSEFVKIFNQQQNSLAHLSEVALAYPEHRYVQQIYARSLAISGEYKKAVSVYQDLVNQSPSFIQLKLFLADAQVKSGNYKAASPNIKELLKFAKHHAYLNYLNAIVDFEAQEFESAKLSAERALQAGFENKIARIIAGVSSFRLNNLEQAYNHLQPVADDIPEGHDLKRLLAALQISLGYTDEALINVLESDTEVDPDLVAALGYQLHSKQQTEGLQSLLKKVEGKSIDNPQTLARIGALKLTLDQDGNGGVDELEKVFALDSDIEIAKRLLLIRYLDKGEFDKAIDLANKLIEQYPSKAEGHNYTAVIYERMGEIDKVDQAFSKAIEVEPSNAAALLYFIGQSAQNNDFDSVGKYLKQLLDEHPTHIRGLSLNMIYQKQQGNAAKGLNAYRKAFELSNESLAYRLAYGKALSSEGKYPEVISLLKPVEKQLNLPDLYWHLLANAYINQNNLSAAEYAYKQWSTLAPNNLVARLSLISTIELTNDFNRALRETETALDYFPNDLRLKLMKARYLVEVRQLSKAQQVLTDLNMPSNELVQALQGRIWLYTEQYNKAVAPLTAYYNTDSRAQHAIRVAKAYIGAKQNSDAVDFLKKHIQANEQDVVSKSYLANYLSSQNSLNDASKLFESVLQQQPNNPLALNNLANLHLAKGKLQQAETLALRVTKHHPEMAAGFDTLGSVYKAQEQFDKAHKAYETAFKLNAGSLEVMLNYIESLAKVGQKSLAAQYIDSLEPLKAKLDPSELSKLNARIAKINAI